MFAYKLEYLSLTFWDQVSKKKPGIVACACNATAEKDPGVRWLVVLALSESPRSVRVLLFKKKKMMWTVPEE